MVPDVYWIWAMSDGFTSGRPASAGPSATNAFHSVNRTTSRRLGTSGRTSSKNSAIGLRNSGTKKMPAAPDWLSTNFNSEGR